jgi:hypothetical protein
MTDFSRFTTKELVSLEETTRAEIERLTNERTEIRRVLAERGSPFKVNDIIKVDSKEYVVRILKVWNAQERSILLGTYKLVNESLGRYKEFVFEQNDKKYVKVGRYEDNKPVYDHPSRQRARNARKDFPIKLADNVEMVERIMRPKHERGCDYSTSHRHVLIKKGDLELLWTGGRQYFGGIGTRAYAEPSLDLYDLRQGCSESDEWFEGGTDKGRLSKKLLSQFDKRVRETFGIDFNFSEVFRHDGTVIIHG